MVQMVNYFYIVCFSPFSELRGDNKQAPAQVRQESVGPDMEKFQT